MWAEIVRERFGSDNPKLADDPLPHPDRRGDAAGAAARGEHHPGRAAGLRRGLRRDPVAAHQRLRRGAGAADRALGPDRAAHPAGDRLRVGRHRDRRPLRRLLLRRVADRRDRAPRQGADGAGRRHGRLGRGARLHADARSRSPPPATTSATRAARTSSSASTSSSPTRSTTSTSSRSTRRPSGARSSGWRGTRRRATTRRSRRGSPSSRRSRRPERATCCRR